MRRDVFIRTEPAHHSILVVYKERAPRARKLYAQFDDRHKTLGQVVEYVHSNSVLLRLVCPISGREIFPHEVQPD